MEKQVQEKIREEPTQQIKPRVIEILVEELPTQQVTETYNDELKATLHFITLKEKIIQLEERIERLENIKVA